MVRPSDLRIPVYYPNDYTADGAGMSQRDYDDGEIGGDSLRTLAELVELDTFNRLEPEFQRSYIALVCILRCEYGLLLGIGTGWRDYLTQLAAWTKNSKQFSNPRDSLHVNRGPFDVAYAIDTVPYDALNAAHRESDRVGISYLTHIPNERHHCYPSVLAASGSQFTEERARLARNRRRLPYLGILSLAEWMAADAELEANPAPTPPPPVIPPAPTTPTPTPPAPPPADDTEDEDTMIPAIVKTTNGPYLAQFRFRGPVYTVGATPAHDVTDAEVFGRGDGRALDIASMTIVDPAKFKATPAKLTVDAARALLAGTD